MPSRVIVPWAVVLTANNRKGLANGNRQSYIPPPGSSRSGRAPLVLDGTASRALVQPGQLESDGREMIAAWTKDPKVTGAYWVKLGDLDASMVWVHNGNFFDYFGVAATTKAGNSGAMFYGPLDQPPPMTEQKEPEATTVANIPAFREHHDVAMLAAHQWASVHTHTVADSDEFGAWVARAYLSCLAKLAEKPEVKQPSEPFKYPNMADAYIQSNLNAQNLHRQVNQQANPNVFTGSYQTGQTIGGTPQCYETKCCKGG